MPFPTLYQISTRDWLGRLSSTNKKLINLAELPDSELDRLAELGFEWLYLLGVWQTGATGASISRSNPAWLPGYVEALANFTDADVSGSPFAVQAYTVHRDFGGDEALSVLRDRLRKRNVRLMLDFVPNHMAIDHRWTVEHPNRFIRGSDTDLASDPANFVGVAGPNGKSLVFAHGRDPYFPGWVDTIQLDYSSPDTCAAMAGELTQIAGRCDGVRCDMAMLLLPDVFERTWNRKTPPFWPAAIAQARAANPDFVLMAEVYWGLEWQLQQQGFDFTYDKTLYDRLLARNVEGVRSHLEADLAFQTKLVRFLENHDEPRIASELSFPEHKAGALLAYMVPGLRFLHDGQLEGFRRKPSIHLSRREREPADPEIQAFYKALLQSLRSGAGQGSWRLLPTRPAWNGNWTAGSIVCCSWTRDGQLAELIAVNFSDHASQCYVPLPAADFHAKIVTFRDLTGTARYERSGSDLIDHGLYLDLPPWGGHLFQIEI